MKNYKTITEKGTLKHLVKFVGESYWIPSFATWKESFIQGEVYKAFKMKNGFQIIIEGKFINELGKVKTLKRTFNSSGKMFRGDFDYLVKN